MIYGTQTMDINLQHHNLLGNQISRKSEDFCILVAIFGHHSKPKWSPYGAACLIPCKYPFPLKSVYFLIFNDFFNFYIGGHFENFNNKEHNFWVMIYFCVKFQKDLLYGLNLTFFAPWLPWQWPPFWICSTPQKLTHTTVIFLQRFMKLDEMNPFFF